MEHSLPYLVNCSLMFTEEPLLQRPAAARAAGFSAVEFWWPFAAPVPSDHEVDAFVTAVGEALFVHTPDGYGTSELAEALFRIIGPPGKTGITATARNWATSTKLLSLCEET